MLVQRVVMVVCMLWGWPNEGGVGDVVFVWFMLFVMFVIVVICCCCDGENHGEELLLFVFVAGWSGDGGVMICCH